MGKSKLRIVLVACVMIMLCSAAIVGGTYALWSDSVALTNHLTAGTLDVKLERTSLTKTYLDATTGYLVTGEADTTVIDFTSATSENVFGIASGELVAPGCAYEAALKITNNGDVAFTYDVIITLTSTSDALAEQLKVYVDGEAKGYLSEYATEGGKAIIATQDMAKDAAAKTFTVKVVFEDLTTNNAAMDKTATFDLSVNATQKVSA